MGTGFYRIDSPEVVQERLPDDINCEDDNIDFLKDIFELFSTQPVGAKWFYVDNMKLCREDSSGNIFKPEIKFSPCYLIYSEKLGKLVLNALKEEPEIKRKYNRPHLKAKRGKNFSVKCVIECCKVLGRDFWKVLEVEEMKEHTSSEKIRIPEASPELEQIVAWILTEGHLPLSHPSIEINQIKEDSEVLEKLAKKVENVFDAESVVNFSDTESWDGKKGRRLIISSAPIRQFLVLKYDIPLGKKSKKISWNIEITEENYRSLLPAFIQSEGCLSAGSNHPRFEFKIQDECVRDACHKCLEYLGCEPQKSDDKTYNTGIYNFEDFLKVYNFIKTEMNNKKLENKSKELIRESNILAGLKNDDWCSLVNEARLKLDSNSPNKAFVELHNEIFPDIEINHSMVSSWALGKAPARLSAAIISQKVKEAPHDEIFSQELKSYISSSKLKKHVRPKL